MKLIKFYRYGKSTALCGIRVSVYLNLTHALNRSATMASYFSPFSNLFLNILKTPLSGLSWKTEIYRPEEIRPGPFTILHFFVPFSKLCLLWMATVPETKVIKVKCNFFKKIYNSFLLSLVWFWFWNGLGTKIV